MNSMELGIVIFSIVIILYVAIAGFCWPFTKAFGLSGLLSFWKTSEQLKKKIKEAIQKLPKADSAEDQRNKFAEQYNKINDYFKNQSVFSHLWQEFTEQLVEPTDKTPFFQNSIRPEKFFTLEDFLKRNNINLKLLESMPGILLGLGVLGTFVGLSISLIQAFPLLQGNPETERLTEAVQKLISGAGYAFFTSVAGLVCSLIFNIISDKQISALQIKLNKFNFRLEKGLKFITEEDLLMECLEESKQQGKHLSSMDEKIALKIGDIIKDSVKQMGEKVQQVISQGNQNISERFLDNIANQMTKGMGDFSRKQLENMEKILSSLQNNIPPLISRLENAQKQNEIERENLIRSGKDSQDQINKSLIDTIQTMKDAFKEIAQNLNEKMDQIHSNSLKKLENLLSNVSKTSDMLLKQTEEAQKSFQKDIDQTTGKLHDFADRLGKVISELSDTTIPKIQSAVEIFNEAAEQQNQIVENNKQYIRSLNSLSEGLKEMSRSMSNTMENLPDFITQINQSNESLKEVWSNYEKRFSNIDESAKKLFENIHEGLASISKESAEYINNLYQQSANVSGHFSQAVEDLREAVSELSEAVNNLKQMDSDTDRF